MRKMFPCGKTWIPHQYITLVYTIVYIKIKSHQLRSNGYPKYHARLQLCLALVYSNANPQRHIFPLRCDATRIRSPLYFHSLNMYYGMYPVDMDFSDFTAIAY